MDNQKDSRQAALTTAANVLQYKNRSRRALLDRLLAKGIGEEDARYAVRRLTEMGYLDDGEYARLVAESLKNRGYGRYRIQNELRRKKLEADVIEEALADFEADDERLEAFLARRLGEGPYDRKKIKNVNDALIRRGFSWEEARRAIREYISSTEADFED